MKIGNKKAILYTISILLILAIWQGLSALVGKSYLLPSPWMVLKAIADNWNTLWQTHIPATLRVMGEGGGISIVLGVVLAILMDLSNSVKQAVYPLLTFTQTVPVLCLAPVLVLWFGYTPVMRVIVVVLVTFFSISVNVYDGFHRGRQDRTQLLATYGAGIWQQYVLLRFPCAFPYFLTALRISLPWAGVGAVISEWLGAPSGVGVFSKDAMMRMDAAGLLAPLVLLSAIVLVLHALLGLVARKCSERSL